MSILFDQVRQFKSSLYEVARGVLRSRERLAERNQEQDLEIKRLSEKNEQLTRRAKQREQRLLETELENEMLRCENDRLSQQPLYLTPVLPACIFVFH